MGFMRSLCRQRRGVLVSAALVAACLSHGAPQTKEERNLLSVAYKSVVGARREGWSKVQLAPRTRCRRSHCCGQTYAMESKEKLAMEVLQPHYCACACSHDALNEA